MNNAPNEGVGKRSVIRNLLISMLAFGLTVGLIFPPFARVVLQMERAYSPLFIIMCVIAGLIVGFANYMLFNMVVTRELSIIQGGMDHINQNISEIEVMTSNCLEECTLDVNSADIIGDISQSFNNMAFEIFGRLELEGETRQLNAELMHHVELEDVANTMLKRIAESVNAKAGALYGGSTEEMRLYALFGIDDDKSLITMNPASFGPIEKTLKSGKVEKYAQKNGWEWFSQTTPFGSFKPGAILLVPLMSKKKAVGLVILACDNQALDEKQKKTIHALRSFAAPYLDNSILHKRISDLAAIDELTGILNRRFGMRRLKEEFSRATRHGAPISAVMLDIDHFKVYNDTYGHLEGDKVLVRLGQIINSCLRTMDSAYRYGGEEFTIILPETTGDEATNVAGRLKTAVELECFLPEPGKIYTITISIGVTEYHNDEKISDFILRADKAMYKSKATGRNRISSLYA